MSKTSILAIKSKLKKLYDCYFDDHISNLPFSRRKCASEIMTYLIDICARLGFSIFDDDDEIKREYITLDKIKDAFQIIYDMEIMKYRGLWIAEEIDNIAKIFGVSLEKKRR